MARSVPPYKRLMSGYSVCPDMGCWIWNGATYQNGYGWLKAFGQVVSAHRLSFELHKGPIPKGMHILHSCDVKACVNPDHLRAGTHADNMKEAADRGLMRSGARHPQFGVSQKRPNQANKVSVLGKEYESQKSAERALGLGSGTVRYWIKNNPNKAKLIPKETPNA